MKLKDIWLFFTVNKLDRKISFCTNDSEGSEWWIGDFEWGGNNLFKTKRQAIAFAKRIRKAFNDSQKGK